MPSDGGYLRLHPVSLVFQLGAVLRRLVGPLIFVLLFARPERIDVWIALVFAPWAILGTIVRYMTFRYRLDPEELVVRRGLLMRNERHIPYARVQNVDLVQNVFMRMLGVAEVRIQTASGAEAEAAFKVLSSEAIETMRAKVGRGKGRDEEAPAPARVLAEVPLGERILFGLISNRGMVVVAAAFGLLMQATGWEPGTGQPPVDPALFQGVSLLLALAGLLLFVVGVRILSAGYALFAFHDFTLTLADEDLRTTRGLLTRISATIPRHRIQMLSIRETPLHRLLGRVSVRVESAGGSAGDREREGRRREDWLVPLMRAEDLPTLLRAIEPELDVEGLEWKPVHRSALRRLVVRRSVLFAVPGLALSALTGFAPAGWVLFAVVVGYAALTGFLHARSLAWAEGPGRIAARGGWWTRTTSLTRHAKIQAVESRNTPFDRRWGTATVAVDTAGAQRFEHRIRIPYLEEAIATALHRRLAVAAETAEFRW